MKIWVRGRGLGFIHLRLEFFGFFVKGLGLGFLSPNGFWVDVHHLDEHQLKIPIMLQPEFWGSWWFQREDGGFWVMFLDLGGSSSCP